MKDNEANTRQNNGKNLFTNVNYFSQLVIGYRGKFVFNRRLTQIDADRNAGRLGSLEVIMPESLQAGEP